MGKTPSPFMKRLKICLLVLCAWLPHFRGSAAALNARPNILFIAVDDLRCELPFYGATQIHSPNLERLAARGMVFARAYCQQAVCSPSRTSLLTGLRPDTTYFVDYHGVASARHGSAGSCAYFGLKKGP